MGTIPVAASAEIVLIFINPLSARCGVYSTRKHVPASLKAKPQVGEIEKL